MTPYSSGAIILFSDSHNQVSLYNLFYGKRDTIYDWSTHGGYHMNGTCVWLLSFKPELLVLSLSIPPNKHLTVQLQNWEGWQSPANELSLLIKGKANIKMQNVYYHGVKQKKLLNSSGGLVEPSCGNLALPFDTPWKYSKGVGSIVRSGVWVCSSVTYGSGRLDLVKGDIFKDFAGPYLWVRL